MIKVIFYIFFIQKVFFQKNEKRAKDENSRFDNETSKTS